MLVGEGWRGGGVGGCKYEQADDRFSSHKTHKRVARWNICSSWQKYSEVEGEIFFYFYVNVGSNI